MGVGWAAGRSAPTCEIYYVSVQPVSGMVDDSNATIKESRRAADLAISIRVIKLGKSAGSNDSLQFSQKCVNSCHESERVYIDLFDFENYKNEKGEHTFVQSQRFEYDLIKSIPKQIEKFFEIQKLELDSDLQTAKNIEQALKLSEALVKKENPLEQRMSLFPSEYMQQQAEDQG